MPHLKVRFDEPEHGWIGLLVEVDGASYHYNCSYAGPGSESFSKLISVLLALTDQRGAYTAEWFHHPECLRLVFLGDDEGITLVAQHIEEPFRAPREVVE